ncbi:fucose 4-O-acetylase-like acetyltransferase [Modestobacter roseus]|uniref:Fucose 4-O-acetylase-like acetyltransferase n=3 Tax=Modestobacter roseus TaxID=1181884 RepID=A0A562IXQ2_9ACTN|nr:acyltransferase [Modestobacter roseus]TWH75354.1 fucose 4-O-acetylase-like acetyltransferase [Modestobacter roseus]
MTPSDATPARVAAIDVARAVAVIGVVVNHSIDGMVGAGLIGDGHPLERLNAALYVFRMPALALLLGLFIPRSVARRGVAGYLAHRGAVLVWLYLLWFALQSSIESLTSDYKNLERPWGAIVRVWEPFAHLWFLPFLLVASAVLAVLQPWRGRARQVLAGGGLVLVGVLLWGWDRNVVGLTGLSLLAFAAVGSMLGLARLGGWMQRSAAGWAAAGVAAGAVFLALLQLGPVPGTLPEDVGYLTRAVSALAAAAGTLALLAVAVLLSRSAPVAAFLAAIGRRTLPVYLAHVVIVAGVRVALGAVGVDQPVVIVVVAVLAGVGLPFAAAVFADGRPWASWLFDLPEPLRRRLPRPRARQPLPAPEPNTVAAANAVAPQSGPLRAVRRVQPEN